MKIQQVIVGSFETNCYVIRGNCSAKDCVIIDAGLEPAPLVDYLQKNKLNPLAVILTHGHIDHIAGLEEILEYRPDMKIYIHSLDEPMLAGKNNLFEIEEQPFRQKKADVLLEDGEVVELAGIRLKVLHTPGHTPGGICLYSDDEQIAFVGDTLFAGSVGRTDLSGGDTERLFDSIKEKLLNLPDKTRIFPGHGPATTIAREKKVNPFLQDLI
jgi:hydroxyacylglutathione hydrolase